MHALARLTLGLLAAAAASLPALAQERVPGERWMRFVDVAEAGFDADGLEAARATWEGLPSSAFLVVADGAVVAGWGDLERRFMCHSVRKSFLAALYGIYWDRGELELNKTLADLGLDDEPDPLLDTEKRARILDLLKARSGVFHPAAYAGRTDSRPRGSEGPGRFFAYNNWDFNTLATILEMETGDKVFEAFDDYFGRPLAMQDWRVSDGYYHFELDKSKYPAYPFRMSARDAARFGLLFAREGTWGDERILSRHWVERSTTLYSIDNDVMGYGFMWWVYREPRFEQYGMASALGVGNQMIAALPEIDLVIVNRANTYDGESTPLPALLDLIEQVLEARIGEPVADAELAELEDTTPRPGATAEAADLTSFVGTWPDPPAAFGWPAEREIEVSLRGEELVWYVPGRGTFELLPQADGTLLEEDSLRTYYPLRDGDGALAGIVGAPTIVDAALAAGYAGDAERADELLARLGAENRDQVELARALLLALAGDFEAGALAARGLARRPGVGGNLERRTNAAGYRFLQAGEVEAALTLFELNTAVFPESFNAWDSLAEAHMELGNVDDAVVFYQQSLELNANNDNARAMLARLRETSATR